MRMSLRERLADDMWLSKDRLARRPVVGVRSILAHQRVLARRVEEVVPLLEAR